MDTVLTLLGTAGIWLFWELAGGLLGELLSPIFRLCGRIFTRLVTGRTVALLWTAAGASIVVWPMALKSSSIVVRASALAAFLVAVPVALIATFTWRDKTRPLPRETHSPLMRLRDRYLVPRLK